MTWHFLYGLFKPSLYMFTSPMWPCQHTNRSVLTCILSAWLPILILCHGNWLVREGVFFVDSLTCLCTPPLMPLYFHFSPHQLNGIFQFRLLPVRLLPVRLLPVRLLPVHLLPVCLLPVRLLPVRLLPVHLLPVRLLPVRLLPVRLYSQFVYLFFNSLLPFHDKI